MSAGKGSKLRQGANLSAFWDNYDRVFQKRKTVQEWQKHFKHKSVDWDAFREYNRDDLVTKEQYEHGRQSTQDLESSRQAHSE